jgi:hypothetical protein
VCEGWAGEPAEVELQLANSEGEVRNGGNIKCRAGWRTCRRTFKLTACGDLSDSPID